MSFFTWVAGYKPLLDEVNSLYAGRDRSEVSILVPGAGLGRLAWECAKQGQYQTTTPPAFSSPEDPDEGAPAFPQRGPRYPLSVSSRGR